MNDLIKKIGVKVILSVDFPVVCETLERIGVVNKKEKKIFPSCYLLKYDDIDDVCYKLCHFKEMFILQQKKSTFDDLDKIRRDTIGYLLTSWNLIKPVDIDDFTQILNSKISTVSYREKKDYKIIHKFKNFN
jgi:hypothetical protein